MKYLMITTVLISAVFVGMNSIADEVDGDLRLNDIQVIATHNSYHIAPPPERMKLYIEADPALAEWDYTHAPLETQLDRGVRGFEIDVYYQKDGTFKVMHVPMFDTGSHCEQFTDCLRTIRAWSKAHPSHVPIITHIEVKDEQYERVPVEILPVGKAEIDRLDAAVREVFEPEELFTPDDLRGDYATVNEAATSGGWPKIDGVRGRCIFILHNRGKHRAAYLEDNPAAEGRALFNFAVPGEPDAAFLIRDNPDGDDVKKLVDAGYMIRTRDGGPNNPDRVKRAIATGAHLISTDFPPCEADDETGYVVTFNDGATVRARTKP